MNKVIQMQTPLTKADIKNLRAGDVIELTGTIFTGRDAAHKRIQTDLAAGKPAPVDLSNQFILYAGPTPTRPGRVIGSIAPTTSMRMDSFVEMTFRDLHALGMIGKGDRSPFVADLCKQYGGVYLLSIGGASAIISNQVKSCEIVAFDELGTESIKKLGVEKLRLIVAIDTNGEVFQDKQIQLYSRE